MRILPPAQREAMYEIYNFCRCVDDIADSTGPRPQRLAQLNEWRAQVSALYQGKQGSLTAGLTRPVRDFGLAQEDFQAVIDGMEMDAAEDIRAPSLATLDLYCDRVASAVGRLSVRVFGSIARAAGSSRTIWGGRCNSPISCVISMRTRASAASTCRASGLTRPVSRPAIRPRPCAAQGWRRFAAGSWIRLAGISRKPTRSWQAHHGTP
jgi:hypothetical protein